MSLSFEDAKNQLVSGITVNGLFYLVKSVSGVVGATNETNRMNQTPHLQLSKPRMAHYLNIEENSNMAYVLETISPKDVEKILVDIESDQTKKRRVIGDRLFTGPGILNWAVNRESNSYIFHAPTTREQAINPRFYFFYQNVWYELWVNDLFGNVVRFESLEPDSETARQEFRRHLKEALFVFGRYSTGSTDFSDSIVAEFEDEKAWGQVLHFA